MPNAIINKAEIEFTAISSGYPLADSAFKPCSRLYPWMVTTTNEEQSFYNDDKPNFTPSGLSTITQNGIIKKRYLINITSLIQRTITTKDSSILLNIRGFNTATELTVKQGDGRIVLAGNNNNTDKIKLNLIYTKLK